MSVMTTNEIIHFINELETNDFESSQALFANLLQRLPADPKARNRILNPKPPAISPVTLLGTKLAKGEIDIEYFDLLKDLIKAGGNPNLHDEEGLCIIHHAAMQHHQDSDELMEKLIQLSEVKKDMTATEPYPSKKNIVNFLTETINHLQELESEDRNSRKDECERKLEHIERLIGQGYANLLFDTPTTTDASIIPQYLKKVNPVEIMFGYVTEKLLKGQKKDSILELHESKTKLGDKPILDIIKGSAFKKAIQEAFIKDVLMDTQRLDNADARLYKQQMDRLELLLNNPKISPTEVINFVSSIPKQIKKQNVQLENILALVKKRAEFIEKCEKTEKDYSQMKMTGHCLGLRGRFENGDNNVVTYEEFDVNETLPRLAEEATAFVDVAARESEQEAAMLMRIAAGSFEEAAKSRKSDDYTNQAQRYLRGEPVMIPCIYEDHFASAVLYKDKLYFCNKDSGCTEFPGIECYKINLDFNQIKRNQEEVDKLEQKIAELDKEKIALGKNDPLTAEDKKRLSDIEREIKSLNTRKDFGYIPNQNTLAILIKEMSTQTRYSSGANNTAYENLGLRAIQDLKPELLYRKKLHGQKQGNCSYTNNKRAFEALMLAVQDDPENKGKYNKVDARKMYQQFSQFDRLKTIRDHINYYASQNPRDERLLDPLINFLRYKAYFNNPAKIELAKEVLNGLRSVGFTDEQIARKMNEIKYPPHKLITSFINVATDLKEGSQISEKRKFYARRALNTIMPGERKRQMLSALGSAGMTEEGLNEIRHPSRHAEKKVVQESQLDALHSKSERSPSSEKKRVIFQYQSTHHLNADQESQQRMKAQLVTEKVGRKEIKKTMR